MRSKYILVLIIFGILLSLLFIGCSLLGTSIEERVYQFITDINSVDRSTVYKNFDPSINQQDDVADPAFWNVHFPGSAPTDYRPYTLDSLDDSNSTNVITVISANFLAWGPKTVRFEMVQIGTNWLISKMWIDPAALPIVE